MKNKEFEKSILSKKAFSIIELLEVANIDPKSFGIIRKRLLDLGNDILRLGDGDTDGKYS